MKVAEKALFSLLYTEDTGLWEAHPLPEVPQPAKAEVGTAWF